MREGEKGMGLGSLLVLFSSFPRIWHEGRVRRGERKGKILKRSNFVPSVYGKRGRTRGLKRNVVRLLLSLQSPIGREKKGKGLEQVPSTEKKGEKRGEADTGVSRPSFF